MSLGEAAGAGRRRGDPLAAARDEATRRGAPWDPVVHLVVWGGPPGGPPGGGGKKIPGHQ